MTNRQEEQLQQEYQASPVARKLIDPLAAIRVAEIVRARRVEIRNGLEYGPLPSCPIGEITKLGNPASWGGSLPIIKRFLVTPSDAVKLFSLNREPDAVFAFLLFATWVDELVEHVLYPMNIPAPKQLILLIQGSAGSGKTWLTKGT